MIDGGTGLIEQLRETGEKDLQRWIDASAQGNPALMFFFPIVLGAAFVWLMRYFRLTASWPAGIATGLVLAILFVVYSRAVERNAAAKSAKVLERWRPLLDQHIRGNLRERGLLAAILEDGLRPELRRAMAPEHWAAWERPILTGWTKTDLATPRRRISGLIKHYVRCCKALGIEPFPDGYMKRSLLSRLWFWENGDIWQAVLHIALAEALAEKEPGASTGEALIPPVARVS
jgi:hypothetical protein